MVKRIQETDQEKSARHEKLFNQLDIDGNGKIELDELKKAFLKNNHPLKNNDDAIKDLFIAMDYDKNSVVDLNDFIKYVSLAESQIEIGFNKIDVDQDGKIKPSEVSKYLLNLSRNCNGNSGDTNHDNIANNDSNSTSNKVHGKNHNNSNQDKNESNFTKFIHWAFYKKHKNNETSEMEIEIENDKNYITYDQWRDFLLLMPKANGTRLQSAFFYLFQEDVDLSSEGDVTLINDFIKGFGFFIAGGISGVISRTCTAPFDRLKVFLIARTDLSSTLLTSKEVMLANKPNLNLSKIKSPLIKAITTLYRQGGIKAFYVGNGLNVIKVLPESSMKFGSFELTKKIMTKIEGCKDPSELSKVSTYIAGGLAGVVAQFSIYPIDTLKFRMQCAPLGAHKKGNQLVIETARQLYKEGGLKLFYRGIAVGVMGVFPYAALDLGTFTVLKKWYIAKQSQKLGIPKDEVIISNFILLPMGAFSGTVGATAVYPINLLRTRLQAQGTFAHPYRYTGFRDVLKKTIQREGYPGLYKGLLPTLAKVCPAVSISYLCYENLKRVMKLE
ncbi:hypothetical protein Kpol_1020p37 [Vanderwaltozyma polyspora DSM 70294]|uniref:EF-hand domain-containing protein n=1 Tax=Vanderwaltozyma polyspora (strain ATCC 22028 / DSM 70294 / BCRC 21397 / CBS 2163 / NBRC 10782 / NRRL Y-8283 / UCD 57-17) TaxID=436907 RepID=A7TLE7_VANPO|nr:uncharacterized protein Kpol_1020p37 [Vanderwaltozyma polyspora DSM 70294]EDO16928.1 hypothetical protein Kpol_1020p37 [Vanderwaltozyma polyspora DSM 70294]